MNQFPPSFWALLFLFASLAGCSSTDEGREVTETPTPPAQPDEEKEETIDFSGIYRGADLSYVNEMVDCGGIYKNEQGEEVEPFAFFSEKGANLVRVRLWHTPEWTSYSTLEDVRKTISRAKDNGMDVLLDFHYSDTWADPGNQVIPKAWEQIDDDRVLADSLYNYTQMVLRELKTEGLLPEIVQVGNEINSEILQPEDNPSTRINWQRNVLLLNSAIQAVKDISEDIDVMLHIAQPENAIWWFQEAHENGIGDYDWIGLSYYPVWSSYSLEEVPQAIKALKSDYNKQVMIVETAYPFTLDDVDNANNILGETALVSGYEASPAGQRDYLIDLITTTTEAGAEGVIYWEPAWISTNCSTLWGQGSHWDNAALFDNQTNRALEGFDFYDPEKY